MGLIMKLALILSAIFSAIQSIPVNITISPNTTINGTTPLPITSNTTISSSITPLPITQNTTINTTTLLPITPNTTISTTVLLPTTIMPYVRNISCFNNQYNVTELNSTIINNMLKQMIHYELRYTKEYSENKSNSSTENQIFCGAEIYHNNNNTNNKYRVNYGAFNKSYCDEGKQLNIICNDNEICNKTISCCQNNDPAMDNNCNLFTLAQINDTKNSCQSNNSAECYRLLNTFTITTPIPSTTESNAGDIISVTKLYSLLLASLILPFLKIN